MCQRAARSRFLRLTACALASLGLFGHGLAMLLVSLLSGSSVAAQPEFPAFLEICSTDGVVAPAASGSRTSGEPADSQRRPPTPSHGKIDSCPICSAFAQNGAVSLPAVLAVAELSDRQATPLPVDGPAIGSLCHLHALSRGPPARV